MTVLVDREEGSIERIPLAEVHCAWPAMVPLQTRTVWSVQYNMSFHYMH